MKLAIQTIKSILQTRPTNAFLLFITGFFFSQFTLINILYARHPFGGWITNIGSVTNASIFYTLLTTLVICVIAIWQSTRHKKHSQTSSFTQIETA